MRKKLDFGCPIIHVFLAGAIKIIIILVNYSDDISPVRVRYRCWRSGLPKMGLLEDLIFV